MSQGLSIACVWMLPVSETLSCSRRICSFDLSSSPPSIHSSIHLPSHPLATHSSFPLSIQLIPGTRSFLHPYVPSSPKSTHPSITHFSTHTQHRDTNIYRGTAVPGHSAEALELSKSWLGCQGSQSWECKQIIAHCYQELPRSSFQISEEERMWGHPRGSEFSPNRDGIWAGSWKVSERFHPRREEWKGIKARGNKTLNTDMCTPQPVQSMGRWSLGAGGLGIEDQS